ncbi:hypothetical protein ACGFX8_36750 [Streptomyces sp. NPDC048362]|uniref:hypothetical protein n=1 Tax=Streptomyces sp. NPDC048362 TaxID=3365539 RepID=UPI003720E210
MPQDPGLGSHHQPALALVQMREQHPDVYSLPRSEWKITPSTSPGFTGGERTTRRTVAEAKAQFRAGRRRIRGGAGYMELGCSDGLWEIAKPLIPPSKVRPQGGG